MGSSFSRKSSSSASKAPKPTYRRASTAGKGPVSARVAVSSKEAAPSKGRTAVRPAAEPSLKVGRKVAPAAKTGVKIPASKMPRTAAAKPVAAKVAMPQAPAANAPASKTHGARAAELKVPGVKSAQASKTGTPKKVASAALTSVGNAAGSVSSRIPLPKVNPAKAIIVCGILFALVLAGFIIANSALFAATDIQVRGSDHVEEETARALIEVPENTTLLNVDDRAIFDSLKAIPWVKDVKIEREWPNTLIVTPVERQMRAIAYVTADEIAWGIGEDGAWIAPLSLVVAVDAEGNEVPLNDDGSLPEGTTQLPAFDAALRLAQNAGSLLLTDVPSDVSPKGGKPVTAKVVLAGLEYANGFSAEFSAQIKDISVASVEAISANLVSGVEVSLGKPESIVEKERVVTKLLAEQQGVTYINVREPGAYTFRAAPL